MAEASILVDQHQFSCPVCLDLLKDPVTIHCGHSFCKVCINDCWDQEDKSGVYSCHLCKDTFTPRPVLHRNNMLAEVVEKLKKAEIPDASPAQCDTGPEDEECDHCTERKRKACMCCMMCLSCFCLKKNQTKYTIFDAEKICCEHKMIEIDCCTDQSYICSLCMLNKHQGHAVSNESERAEKQSELKENQKKVEELKQAVNTIKLSAQTAVEQINAWEETELSRLQRQSPTFEGHPLFDGVKNSLSDLKMSLEEFCEEEFIKIPPHVEDAQSLLSEPQRDEFLKYFRYLTLDPNTAHQELILSKKNRVVRYSEREQQYPDHPERFDYWPQVLSKESVSGRCYWEVEWESDIGVAIAVVYNEISRKGSGEECKFACSNQSWSLECPSVSSVSFYDNSIKIDLRAPSSRIGVYVDHSAGTLSFYSVSYKMKLLHRVHTTFTQPLYAGFGFYDEAWNKSAPTIRLCDSKKSRNIWLNFCRVL